MDKAKDKHNGHRRKTVGADLREELWVHVGREHEQGQLDLSLLSRIPACHCYCICALLAQARSLSDVHIP